VGNTLKKTPLEQIYCKFFSLNGSKVTMKIFSKTTVCAAVTAAITLTSVTVNAQKNDLIKGDIPIGVSKIVNANGDWR
jgi:hypothetical protein